MSDSKGEIVGSYMTWSSSADERIITYQRIERQADSLHPQDADKLRYIVEALRSGAHHNFIEGLIAELMVCVRSDCSAVGADRVTDRLMRGLIGSALDSADVAEIVLAKIHEARA